jgi:hypothetical protein
VDMIRFYFEDKLVFESPLGNARIIPNVGDKVCAPWTNGAELIVTDRTFYYDDDSSALHFHLVD